MRRDRGDGMRYIGKLRGTTRRVFWDIFHLRYVIELPAMNCGYEYRNILSRDKLPALNDEDYRKLSEDIHRWKNRILKFLIVLAITGIVVVLKLLRIL